VLEAVLLANLAALDATEAVKMSMDMLSQGTGQSQSELLTQSQHRRTGEHTSPMPMDHS